KHAAGAITLSEQDTVTDDDRVGGVDAFERLCPPREPKVDPARRRVEADQAVPRPIESHPLAADVRDDGAGIARQFVGGAVPLLAGPLVERDKASAVTLQLAELIRF